MYDQARSWPFTEAAALNKEHGPFSGDAPVRFETGFGPSGLPHIGTFSEVARTTWVKNAFTAMTGLGTELIAFSDDMDGLRKVPLNIPNPELVSPHLGKPLSSIPDPFGCCESYSAHMNNKLCAFLDAFGFTYRFQSSTAAYRAGDFDEGLRQIARMHEPIRELITATLREENRESWSPFMPVCPQCGRVYTTRVTGVDADAATVDFICDGTFGSVTGCGHAGTVPVTGGTVKVGWKVDWALRWYSYGVSYEMYGKDLIESARLSAKICRLLGKKPPSGLFYEMFLDENGEKISKSVGRGLTVDTWMEYAPVESLLYYIFQNPRKAKRLFFGMIPKVVDDYLEDLRKYARVEPAARVDSAAWHVFSGNPPAYDCAVSFSTVNNLVSAVGADDRELLLSYLRRYDEHTDQHLATVEDLIGRSLAFYRDFILPTKVYRKPDASMRPLFEELLARLKEATDQPVEVLHAIPFDIAKAHDVEPPAFFLAFYQALLGQERGPRFGSFVQLVGTPMMISMLEKALGA